MQIARSGLVLAAGLLLAASAWAQTQSGIAGVVRDTSGAVMPGVTVEAASPALIEKVRVAVTDTQGRFNIVDLRPGIYSVTFTLPGFATYKREGIELSAGFTATANAELKVGGLEETVTVTGASPVVDIQNVRTQQVLKAEVLDSLPSGQRDLTQFASLTLGATASTPGRNDVGGSMGESNTGLSIHGGRGDDGRVNYDGMNTNHFFGNGGGQQRIWKFNTIGVQETVVDTGGSSAEVESGGANVNMIPRDGGNTFSVHSVVNYTNEHFASGAVSDALIARGSAATSKSLKKVYDYGVGIGGPVMKDRIWFYNANRFWGGQSYGANNYFDKSTVFYRYEADLTRPAFSDFWQRDIGGRFTVQATQKNKFTSSLNWQRACGCWLGISSGARSSPDATVSFQYGKGHGMWLSQSSWTYPATNRLLFQAGASFLVQAVTYDNAHFPGPNDVSILEQTTGYRWGIIGAGTDNAYLPHKSNNFTQRAAVSYITGSHALKAGMQTLEGRFDPLGNALPDGVNYVFRNGLPLQLEMWASPFENHVRVRNLGLYAQDQWTVQRFTINGGVRFDHFNAYSLAFTVPAGPFKAARPVPGVNDLPNFKDLTPRLGVSFDVFGNGKTAVKASWGRYLMGQGAGDARTLSPAETIFLSTTRLWNDTNGNFRPDCVLTNLQANGECGTVANLAFGQPSPVQTWEQSARVGWGVREYNYQYSVSLQHELRSGLGLTLAYNRTDWKNQQAVINRALGVSDYTEYCITAPTDARLDAVSGQQVCGLFDENPAKFGQRDEHRVLAKDVPGANGVPKEIFNGVDLGMNARFDRGALLAGGVTIGRTVFDYCWQNDLPNVRQNGTPGSSTANTVGTLPRTDGFCEIKSGFWNGVGSQIKVQGVYPLPGGFIVSGTFKNLPGIPIPATYTYTNSVATPSLGRDLGACRGAVPCTATASVLLLPAVNNSGDAAAIKFDERLNEMDLRFTRRFLFGRAKIEPVAELYNVLNARPAQSISTTYGSTWQLPTAFLGGRLLKFGVQIDY